MPRDVRFPRVSGRHEPEWRAFVAAYERARRERISASRDADARPLLGARWPFWIWLVISIAFCIL